MAFMAVLRNGKLQAKDLEPAPPGSDGMGLGMGCGGCGMGMGGGCQPGGPGGMGPNQMGQMGQMGMGPMVGPMGPMGGMGPMGCGKGGCKGTQHGPNRTEIEFVNMFLDNFAS